MPQHVYGPTFEEMLHPDRIPGDIRARALKALEEAPLDPINLFNITWKDPANKVRYIVLEKALTGVEANIVVLYGKEFPTGSHKVGPTYAVAMEKQLQGEIQPGAHTLVWPSTGNYGIGGAWVGPRLGYRSVVVLPEMMSRERFDRIESYGATHIATPGCESNVKEIYDACKELAKQGEVRVLNQFEAMANYRFHYYVTGNSVVEAVQELAAGGGGEAGIGNGRVAAFVSAMGSAGTIAAGDLLKQRFGTMIVGLEPIQCPTLFMNGYGGHDIQGIGDKHVTWIHNTDAMDAVACLDEWDCKKGLQVIAEEPGRKVLARRGVKAELLEAMAPSFGISGICNVLGAIKTAKRFRLGRGDVLFTIATDGLDRYPSVLSAMTQEHGRMDEAEAERRIDAIFHHQQDDWYLEGTQHARDCWANLKYYTWVEQQGKTVDELRRQRSREYWLEHQALVAETDKLIREQRPKS